MNYILLIMNIFITYAIETKPKLCINCKFFQKDFFTINKFGKCALFPIKDQKNEYFLVDGKDNEKKDYYFCSTARNFDVMCGAEGKLYEKKI